MARLRRTRRSFQYMSSFPQRKAFRRGSSCTVRLHSPAIGTTSARTYTTRRYGTRSRSWCGRSWRTSPALAMIRLFSEIVGAAGGGKAKRPDRLIQQAISSAVTDSESIPLIGGGRAKPGEVKTWEHDLDHVVPHRIASELKLPSRDLVPVFGDLR